MFQQVGVHCFIKKSNTWCVTLRINKKKTIFDVQHSFFQNRKHDDAYKCTLGASCVNKPGENWISLVHVLCRGLRSICWQRNEFHFKRLSRQYWSDVSAPNELKTAFLHVTLVQPMAMSQLSFLHLNFQTCLSLHSKRTDAAVGGTLVRLCNGNKGVWSEIGDILASFCCCLKLCNFITSHIPNTCALHCILNALQDGLGSSILVFRLSLIRVKALVNHGCCLLFHVNQLCVPAASGSKRHRRWRNPLSAHVRRTSRIRILSPLFNPETLSLLLPFWQPIAAVLALSEALVFD